jgi:hypothetical protein
MSSSLLVITLIAGLEGMLIEIELSPGIGGVGESLATKTSESLSAVRPSLSLSSSDSCLSSNGLGDFEGA